MENLLKNKINQIDEALKAVEEIIFNGLVCWDSIKRWRIGQTKTINNSLNTLIYKEENIMIFETIIPPKTIFPMHWHNFNEQNFVISGVYTDNGKTYSKDEWIKYGVGVPHQVSNNGDNDLRLIVIFTHTQ